MAFDRSRTLESKLSSIARRNARKGKLNDRLQAIARDKSEGEASRKAPRQGWR